MNFFNLAFCGTVKENGRQWEGRLVIGHKNDGKPIYKTVLAKTQKDLTEKLNQFKEAYSIIRHI